MALITVMHEDFFSSSCLLKKKKRPLNHRLASTICRKVSDGGREGLIQREELYSDPAYCNAFRSSPHPPSLLCLFYGILYTSVFTLFLISQRRNTEQAREKAISVEPYVDNSPHLAVWTWKQANLEPHSPLGCHFAVDTLSTSHHVPFARWHFAHHSLCSTLAPSPAHSPYCLCQCPWGLLDHPSNEF